MGENYKHRYAGFLVFILFICLFTFSVFAQATSQNTMTLYGQLFNTSGSAALGAHTINVTIYDASTSGNALFSEEHNVTVLADGMYTLIIGDGFTPGSSTATNGIPASVFATDNWYLGIKVDTDDEMAPRIRITSAPYAISAGQLGGLDASEYVTKIELDSEGFIKTETDPVYAAAPAAGITDAGSGLVTTGTERTNWNAAFGWGDHATAGYLTTGDNLGNHTATSTLNMNGNYIINSGSGYSGDLAFNDDLIPVTNGSFTLGNSSFRWSQLHVNGIYLNGSLRTSWPTEVDPVFNAAPAAGITNVGSGRVTTATERTNWNAAYGWGNHATAGYLTAGDNLGNHTATNNLNMNSRYIINSGSGYSGDVAFNDDVIPTSNGSHNLGSSSYRWGQLHVNGIYLNGSLLTSWPMESDPLFSGSPAASITNAGSGRVTTATERTNWNTAYGWGNHATAGYLTAGDNLGNHMATTNLNMNSRYIVNSGSGYSGDVAFNDDIIPTSTGTYSLGTNTNRWGQLHVNGIYLNGSLRTSWPTGTVTGTGVSGRLALWNGSSDLTSSSGINYIGSNIACGTAAVNNYKIYGYTDANNYGYVGGINIGTFGQGSTFGVYGSGNTYGVFGSGGDWGVYGIGSSYGVYGRASTTNGVYGEGAYCGVYGFHASGSQGRLAIDKIGVYGYGSQYGVYYSGGLAGSGTKSAIVRTVEGPKTVYCQESPENWFEDFGSAEIIDGKAIVSIADDFLQTVTIDNQNPMKVFITPNGNIGNWWVEKGDKGFTLFAKDANDGVKFDYRVVAKRQGYEDLRLKPASDSYTDHYLYPDLKDVPQQYRLEWIKRLSRSEDGKLKITPEQKALLTPEQIEELDTKPNPEASTTDNSNNN